MKSDGSDFFQEFMKSCQDMCNNAGGINNSGGSSSNTNNCSDIPGGFQDLNPQLFLLMGELLGNVMAGNMPFNVQNAIGNWLELVGQAIETFNAQQQYFQGGPGRYYNLKYRNVTNPFCTESNDEAGKEIFSKKSSSSKSGTTSSSSEIAELQEEVASLKYEINKLKSEINKLKNKE